MGAVCKLRIKNKLMRKGRAEEAGRMAVQIGLDIARSNSISLRHINQRNGTKELWGAVRKLTKRCQEDQIAPGIDATILNNHYAKISTDMLYTAPPKKNKRDVTGGALHRVRGFQALGQSESYSHRSRPTPGMVPETGRSCLCQAPRQTLQQVRQRQCRTGAVETSLHQADPENSNTIWTSGLQTDLNHPSSFKATGKAGRETIFLLSAPKSPTDVVFCGPVRFLSWRFNHGSPHSATLFDYNHAPNKSIRGSHCTGFQQSLRHSQALNLRRETCIAGYARLCLQLGYFIPLRTFPSNCASRRRIQLRIHHGQLHPGIRTWTGIVQRGRIRPPPGYRGE